MPEFLLVLNAGSSSLKFCTFHRRGRGAWEADARGQIEGIGTRPRLEAKNQAGEMLAAQRLSANVRDGGAALDTLAAWLRSHYGGAQVLAVGHRVVHGGAAYTAPIQVDEQLLSELRQLIPLAPLHQPHNLAAIEAIAERLPEVPQVACFDTAFHRGLPDVAQVIPLPRDIRDKGVQRYGFHGLSYEYIVSALPDVAAEIAGRRVVVAHLGSGASLCAIQDGKSVDTTLGFTALDGLCMGTRPGALDPGVVLHLFQGLALSAKEVETILYKKSGLLGLSGISNDMRSLLKSPKAKAKLAIDYFVRTAAKQIASMAAALQGVDGIVFTAGIGENSPEIRRRICEAVAWLGVDLDDEANGRGGPRISTARSRISAWVVPTNEELMIARHTAQVLSLEGEGVA